MASEQLLLGTPGDVADYVRLYEAESNANYLVVSFQWGDMSHAEAMSSLQRFASEVMPA
jgi:hypothetical protein